MKKLIYLYALAIVTMLTSCFTPRNSSMECRVKISESARNENFTNDQLRNLIKQHGSPSVVVRNLYSSTSDVSSNANTARIISILEMGLAKNGLDVRDRSLFDNILKSTSANNSQLVDYQKLYEQTQVDLLVEVSNYSVDDLYKVDKYWVGNQLRYFPQEQRLVNGKKQKYHPTYLFRGMSIAVKVIILKDNLIGGTYHYTYVPCSEEEGGSVITSLSPLRYIPTTGGRDINAVINDDSNSSLVQTGKDRLDQAMESFITNTVVPRMISDMKGQAYQAPERVYQAAVLPAPTTSMSVATTSSSAASATPATSTTPSSKWYAVANYSRVTKDSIRLTKQANAEKARAVTDSIRTAKRETADKARTAKLEKLSRIIAVNSFERLAPAVSNLITLKVTEQEKAKKIATLKTDLDKLEVLKGNPVKELENFITTSTTSTGIIPPTAEDSVIIYLPENQKKKNDYALILFIDGQCIGVGGSTKGLYSTFPLNQFTSGFHTLTVTTSEGVLGFTSTVDFSLKNKFIFEYDKKGKIELVN